MNDDRTRTRDAYEEDRGHAFVDPHAGEENARRPGEAFGAAAEDQASDAGGDEARPWREQSAAKTRKRGRPRTGNRAVIPWPEIDRLLVFGVLVRDAETGREDVRYPSQRELGRRFGVSGALIGRYAKEHRCMARRGENERRVQRLFEQKLVEKLAEARALSAAEAIAVVDGYIRAFRDAMAEGRVRADSVSDFNIMVRLKVFLKGQADARREVQSFITLKQLQERHRELQAQRLSLDPAVIGGRDRNRAHDLLGEEAEDCHILTILHISAGSTCTPWRSVVHHDRWRSRGKGSYRCETGMRGRGWAIDDVPIVSVRWQSRSASDRMGASRRCSLVATSSKPPTG